jgi:hypothetical protein
MCGQISLLQTIFSPGHKGGDASVTCTRVKKIRTEIFVCAVYMVTCQRQLTDLPLLTLSADNVSKPIGDM